MTPVFTDERFFDLTSLFRTPLLRFAITSSLSSYTLPNLLPLYHRDFFLSRTFSKPSLRTPINLKSTPHTTTPKKKPLILLAVLLVSLFALLVPATPVLPVARPGYNGREGSKVKRSEIDDLTIMARGGGGIPTHHHHKTDDETTKRSEIDDLTVMARGGGGIPTHHHHKTDDKTTKRSDIDALTLLARGGCTKPSDNLLYRWTLISVLLAIDAAKNHQAREISIDERDSLETRAVCPALKCKDGYHPSNVHGEKRCRCIPDLELEKRISCKALHCPPRHHAIYVDGKPDNCRCVPNGIRGGKRGLEDGPSELEKRSPDLGLEKRFTKANCAKKTCPPFEKPGWNQKDRKCLCAAIP